MGKVKRNPTSNAARADAMGAENESKVPAVSPAARAAQEEQAKKEQARQLIAPGLDARRLLAIVKTQEDSTRQLLRNRKLKAKQIAEIKQQKIEREIEESKAVRTMEDPRQRHAMEENELNRHLSQLREQRDQLSKSKHEAQQRKELTEEITQTERDFLRRTAQELKAWWSQLTKHEQAKVKNADKIVAKIEALERGAYGTDEDEDEDAEGDDM